MRPTEVDLLLRDSSKIEKVLGWKANIKGKKLAEIMVLASHNEFLLKNN